MPFLSDIAKADSSKPRLLACYGCNVAFKVPSLDQDPHNDVLDRLVEQHQHWELPESKRRGMLFGLDISEEQWEALDLKKAVNQELAQFQHEMSDVRDTLKEDAAACFLRHGNPVWPQEPCIDVFTDAKRIGRVVKDKDEQLFLCAFCPYISSVTTDIRFRRGDYK